MLVLSRKKNEQICIGNDVVITILQTGNPVRIGIEAPQELRVMRGEIAEISEVEEPTDTLPASK